MTTRRWPDDYKEENNAVLKAWRDRIAAGEADPVLERVMGDWEVYTLKSHIPRDVFLTLDADGVERFAELDGSDYFVWVVNGDIEYPPNFPDWTPVKWRRLRDDEDFRPAEDADS